MTDVGTILTDLNAARPGTTPVLRAIRQRHSRDLRTASAGDVLTAAIALDAALPQEWKWVAYELVRHHPGAFGAISTRDVTAFSRGLGSWYAVDGFGTILVGPLWARGRLPDALIDRWARSPDRWLRRSALVATVGMNARASGEGDPARTLAICARLVEDRDDMVEKALSWALRVLSQRNRDAVVRFVAEHDSVLAARVRREVRNKLSTGVKNPRR